MDSEVLLQINWSKPREGGICILMNCELSKVKGKVTLRQSWFVCNCKAIEGKTLKASSFGRMFQLLFCTIILVHVIWCDQKLFCPETFPVQAATNWLLLIAQATWSVMLKMSYVNPILLSFVVSYRLLTGVYQDASLCIWGNLLLDNFSGSHP